MGAGEAKPSDPDHASLHFFDELLVMIVQPLQMLLMLMGFFPKIFFGVCLQMQLGTNTKLLAVGQFTSRVLTVY